MHCSSGKENDVWYAAKIGRSMLKSKWSRNGTVCGLLNAVHNFLTARLDLDALKKEKKNYDSAHVDHPCRNLSILKYPQKRQRRCVMPYEGALCTRLLLLLLLGDSYRAERKICGFAFIVMWRSIRWRVKRYLMCLVK